MGNLSVLVLIVLLPTVGCGAISADRSGEGVGVTVAPPKARIRVTSSQQFTATVSQSKRQRVIWTVTGAGCKSIACGNISTTGLYVAPAEIPNTANVWITATAAADRSKSGTALVTILPAIAVTVSPLSPNVYIGKTQQFSATVQNATNTAVTWSVTGTGCKGSACGTVSGTGLYTAPRTLPSPAAVTIKATSVEDQGKYDATVVVIVPAIIVEPASTHSPPENEEREPLAAVEARLFLSASILAGVSTPYLQFLRDLPHRKKITQQGESLCASLF